MRVVICDEVVTSAERNRRRGLLFALPPSLLALALPLVFGTRNIDASTWRWMGPVLLVATATFLITSIPGRRRRVASAIVQMPGSWAAHIHARPSDLERLGSMRGDPVVRSFGSRKNYRDHDLEMIIGINTDGELKAKTLGGSHLPFLSFRLDRVDELRLAVDEQGSPTGLAFVAAGDRIGYHIRRPLPLSAPVGAVDERSG